MKALQKSLLALGIACASLLAFAGSDEPLSAGSNRNPAASQALAPGAASAAESPTVKELFASTNNDDPAQARDEADDVAGLANAASVAMDSAMVDEAHHWELSIMPVTGAYNPALAYDPLSGNPAIAFSISGYAKLARWSGASWAIETVGSGGTGIDLAFDPVDRNPSVSWGSTKLVFAHWTGAAWKLETIEKKNSTNDVTSLAYAPDGSPAIACAFDADRNGSYDTLKLARGNGTAWKTEVVETGVVGYGVFASLAFDASGNPVIAHGNGTIRYVQWDGSSWVVETAASGNCSSLAFDGGGPPSDPG
jgi:hypothetical protein